MAAAASLPLASAAPSLPRGAPLSAAAAPRRLYIPASSSPKNGSCGCSISGGRRPSARRNAAETYVPGSGKYIAPDYLVKKVTAKEVEELARGQRKVPLIVDFYATWCGPCVLMAQDIEMLAVEYENNALFVKVDTDDEYEFARDMQFMNRALAMSGIDGEELPSEVSVDPAHSMNSIDEDDEWVIVKKQRITILIPPPSHAAASPQASTPKISSKQTSLTRKSRRNCNAARTKHPKQLTTNESQDSPLEGIEVDGNSEKAQDNPSESMVHQDVPSMRREVLLGSPAAPVVKSEWTKHADQGLFHEDTDKATSSFGNIYKPRLPIISSHLTNKVMRARLLERQVAGFGGLRNWLLTCGLGWFVEILDSEQLGMYQIASLTMNQLKEMGLVAVGPRRKLIHAIDSLCQPYQPHQFEIVS